MISSESHVAVIEKPSSGQHSAVPFWRSSPKRLRIQSLLAVTTFFTTTAIGMRYMHNFRMGLPPLVTQDDVFPYGWMLLNLRHIADGLPFSLTLIGILLCHEFGHFYSCQRNKVKATLPFLLPAPTLSGTAGAIIRLRSRINSRRSLMEIGALGPLFGFIVSVPCVIMGLCLSTPIAAGPAAANLFRVKDPILFPIFRHLLHFFFHSIPADTHLLPHPILVASWIGIFITSLNLLPAGQLDGGHIMYALSPRVHRVTSYLTIIFSVLAGLFLWVGWLLWAFLLFLPGMRHPKVDCIDEPLDARHRNMAIACGIIFVLTILVCPFTGTSVVDILNHIFT
jgi:Zn-dependent protease